MKNILIFNYSILLLILMCLLSCDDDFGFLENVPVEYIKCPCSSPKDFIEKFSVDNVLLFDYTKISIIEMEEIVHENLKDGDMVFISYNPETNTAVLYTYFEEIINLVYSSYGHICNFPNEAASWDIPVDGILLKLKGESYEACKANGSIGFSISFSDIVLTSIKKYK